MCICGACSNPEALQRLQPGFTYSWEATAETLDSAESSKVSGTVNSLVGKVIEGDQVFNLILLCCESACPPSHL
jgi:hypothetical protein